MKALILCGGFGTRYNIKKKNKVLKPLIKIDQQSILERIMCLCAKQGITEFILLGGFQLTKLKNFAKKIKYLKVRVLNTGLKTNTAGRLLKAKHLINKNENFLFTYGDSLVDLNLKKNLKNKTKNNYVISTFDYPIPYGGLSFGVKKILKNILEKKTVIPINAGFYILDQSIFSYIKNFNESFEKTTINKIIKKKKTFFKCVNVKNWFPLDTHQDKINLENFLKKKKIS
jgi:glucose-1-phosphate cytidylyltransferase